MRLAFLAHPIILAMIAAMIARGVCVAILWRRGLASRYPGLIAFLALGLLRSLWLLHGGLTSQTGYYERWMSTQWLPVMLYAGLTMDAFRLMASHFRAFKIPGLILGCVFFTVSALLAFSVSGVAVARWAEPASRWIFLMRQYSLFCLIALGISSLVFDSMAGSVRMRSNVRAFVRISMLYFACEAVGSGLNRAMGRVEIGNTLIVAAAIIASALWATRLRPEGERYTPLPVPSLDELDMLQAIDRRALEVLRRARQ